jgi:hypothetical protein
VSDNDRYYDLYDQTDGAGETVDVIVAAAKADERRRVLDELNRVRDTVAFGLFPGRTIDNFLRLMRGDDDRD